MKNNIEGKNPDSKHSLGTLVELAGKYGKNTLLYGTMAFLVYVFGIKEIIYPPQRYIKKQLEQIDKNKEEIHIKGIEKRNHADILIPALLDQLRINTNATRVLLFEFHNSTSNVNNLPFHHFTCTYERIDHNDNTLDYISDNFYFQRTGDYGDFLVKLREKQNLFIPSFENEKAHSRIYLKLMRSYAKSAYFYEIDGLVLPSAILIIISNYDELNEELINRNIAKIVPNIASLLEGINRPTK
jgi:hypothetical protein